MPYLERAILFWSMREGTSQIGRLGERRPNTSMIIHFSLFPFF